jgi:AcrR family transcriptional regulator
MNSAATRRWRRRREARPGELVEAALALFSERGFAATRLDDVAARAGVSKGTVYLYFESKEQLFEAVLRQAVAPNLERIQGLIRSFDGTTEELLRKLIQFLSMALDTQLPKVAKLVIAESSNFPALARMYADILLGQAIPLVRGILERGVARGELRDVDPAAAWPLLIAPVILLALWQQTFAPHVRVVVDRDAVLRAHLDALLHGLVQPKPAPRPRRKR